MAQPFGETVTVVRNTGKDQHGDPLPGSASTHDVTDCALGPLSSDENTDKADTVTSGWTLYRWGQADILVTDQVRVRGQLHNVVGRVREWADIGIEVTLVRVTG